MVCILKYHHVNCSKVWKCIYFSDGGEDVEDPEGEDDFDDGDGEDDGENDENA